jgi:hypothetical protein
MPRQLMTVPPMLDPLGDHSSLGRVSTSAQGLSGPGVGVIDDMRNPLPGQTCLSSSWNPIVDANAGLAGASAIVKGTGKTRH